MLGCLANQLFGVGGGAGGVVVPGDGLELVDSAEILTAVLLEFLGVFAVAVAGGFLGVGVSCSDGCGLDNAVPSFGEWRWFESHLSEEGYRGGGLQFGIWTDLRLCSFFLGPPDL